jgi:hypothetical protein
MYGVVFPLDRRAARIGSRAENTIGGYKGIRNELKPWNHDKKYI